MKILIIDDSKSMRLILKRTLRDTGFGDAEVAEASNGVEALEVIKKSAPDVVLSDWNMPQMTGLELLEQLRAGGTKVKFGFVTSEVTSDMRETAREAGALFLLKKPFDAQQFKEVVGPVLRSA